MDPEEAGSSAPKILCIDDHVDTLTVLSKVLGHRGFEVVIASTIAAAIDAAKQQRFDVLVVDPGLPDGDGLNILSQIRTIYPVRGIVLSGYGMAKDVQRSLAAGYDRHLTKPIEINTLYQAIAEVIQVTPRTSPARSTTEADQDRIRRAILD